MHAAGEMPRRLPEGAQIYLLRDIFDVRRGLGGLAAQVETHRGKPLSRLHFCTATATGRARGCLTACDSPAPRSLGHGWQCQPPRSPGPRCGPRAHRHTVRAALTSGLQSFSLQWASMASSLFQSVPIADCPPTRRTPFSEKKKLEVFKKFRLFLQARSDQR